ncbi:MAG: hypothetical protein U0103_04205 [Candidatus Obscuribacterales bacterium]
MYFEYVAMSGVLVAGIDFSGAKTVPNDTWIAAGSLTNMGLEVDEIAKVGSHKVAAELTKPDICYSAVGIDVPFSCPQSSGVHVRKIGQT